MDKVVNFPLLANMKKERVCAMKRTYRYRRKDNQLGKLSVTIIVMTLVGIMSVQIVSLYQKDQEYIAQEASLERQKASEENRRKELDNYEAYTKTQEYIEDIAKSKLGLVYKGEIIFKEKK